MTLFDFMAVSKKDFDTFDTETDAEVTVCYIGHEDSDYEKFCNGVIRLVDVIEQTSDYVLRVSWSELIKRNIGIFQDFTKQYWKCQYEDDSEFIYQWICEINAYMAGYVPESFYKNLVELVGTLKK